MNKQPTIAPLIALLLIAVIAGCSPVKVSYLGNDAGNTRNVKLFFDCNGLPVDYQIIGEIIATAPKEVRSEKVQQKLKREARQKGANGVLVKQFEVLANGAVLNQKRDRAYQHHSSSGEEGFSGTYVKASLVTY